MNAYRTTVSTRFRPSTVHGKAGSIYYQFIRKRKVKVVTSPYKIFPEEWNQELKTIRTGTFTPRRERQLQEIYLSLRQDEEKIKKGIRLLEKKGNYSLDELAGFYHHPAATLSEFVEELAVELERNKQYRLVEAYRGAARKIKDFNQGIEVPVDAITAPFMKAYESHMKQLGNSPNTISFYNRNTRAIYNKAAKKGIIGKQAENPFADVFTGVAKTRKRAVSQQVMDQLMKLDLSFALPENEGNLRKKTEALKKSKAFSRDLFILSFYLRGISFVDLAYLKKSNVKNNCIVYKRRKTGQFFEIAIHPKIREILRRYAPFCKHSERLLPVLPEGGSRKEYTNALKRQNEHLEALSRMVGLDRKLTTYVARHSWASIALARGCDIPTISQGLGHESEKTTKIYLDTFDFTRLHKANNLITVFSNKTGNKRKLN